MNEGAGEGEMFNRRPSVKSSSSENDDQLLSTPGRKCGRVPLQDVSLQCGTQRDVQSSSSRARCMGVPASSLTPLLHRLHLEDAHRPVSTLVYNDLCKNIFVEEEDACAPWVQGLTPLATQTPPRTGGFREVSSLVTETAEPAGGEVPRPPQINRDGLPQRADNHAVQVAEVITAEAQEDPEPSITAAETVELEPGLLTHVDTAAGQNAGSPRSLAVGVNSLESCPVAESSCGGCPGQGAGQGTEGESQEVLPRNPGAPDWPAQPCASASVTVGGGGEEGEQFHTAGESEESPVGEEGVRLGKRKRLSTARDGEGGLSDGEECPAAGDGAKSDEGEQWVLLPAEGEQLSIARVWDQPGVTDGVPGVLAVDEGEQPQEEDPVGVLGGPEEILAVDALPPIDVCDLGQPRAEIQGQPASEGLPALGGAAGQVEGAAEQVEGAAEQVEGAAGQVEGTGQVEGAAGQVEGAAGQVEGAAGQVEGTGQVEGAAGQVEGTGQVVGAAGQVVGAAGQVVGAAGQVEGAAGQVEVGTSLLAAPVPCALTCLIHSASVQTPADTWKLLAEQIGTRRVTCRDVGTAVTPVGSHCAMTCMTPVSLAEKDVNTSVLEGARCEVMDSAVLTDSLLWNFSREDLESVPRGQLERRLETALLINEVLSSRLSELSNSKGLRACVGPADQRETYTQTTSTQAPEVEEHYRQLYLQQLSRVRELELGQKQYRHLHTTIAACQEQQHSLQEEVDDGLSAADGACEEMQRERARMFQQLQEAREFARESTRTLQAMDRARTRALEEAAALRSRAADVEWKQVNMQQEMENTADGLREALGKVKQLTGENQQLKSGLAALTEQLVGAEAERHKLMKENGRYFVELATAEASLKLSEAALAEKVERLQASEERIKLIDSLQENVQSLKEAVNELRKEKEGLEGALSEAQGRALSLTQALQLKDKELQELSDIRAQAALISDNCEFMEQELKVSREQLAETEGQLSEQIRSLHHRNLQCEELRAQCDHFRSELDTVKKDAREMLMEMGEQMNQAIVQIMDMESQIQNVTRSAETSLKIWQQDLPKTIGEAKPEQQAPAVQSGEAAEVTQPSGGSEHQEAAPCDIRSEQSAFAPIKPTCTDTAGGEDTLLLRVSQLREALGKLVAIRSLTDSTLLRQVQALRQEISDSREQQEARSSKKLLELHSLQGRVVELEAENRQLARDIQAHVKGKCELEETLSHQNETILKFHQILDANLEEHTQYLAMKQEVMDLRRQLQQIETEASTLREEMARLHAPGDTLGKDWLQEKVELQYQVRKLQGAYLQKDREIEQLRERMIRHRSILEENNEKAEAEVAKLDSLIEHVRSTLRSVPEVVACSVELKGLLEYLGDDLGT
ncbi:sperm-associated antigen 5 [Pristis pectinata]|uniref:sperm-associated antigen 5 n=1 Tax=Pristis pectinata TaxID=685728 RepID=UPI00223D8D2A|nr:sperm-associated antigen 5 [Pristis pectinata]